MSFWDSFQATDSRINEILEKENFTLEDILDEEDLLSEIKAQNTKLIEYLSKEKTILELVKHTITEPQNTEEAAYKYAYLSSEVIYSDVQQITEVIINSKPTWNLLFDFVYQSTPLSLVLSSYFFKISIFLMNKIPTQIVEFLKSEKTQFLDEVLKHTNNTPIIQFLIKILLSIDLVENNIVSKWFMENHLIQKIVNFFDRRNSEEAHENISNFLVNLIDQSLQLNSNALDLYSVLENQESVNVIVKNMLSNDNAVAKRTSAATVILQIIKRNSSDIFDYSTPIESLPAVLQIVLQHFGEFISIITSFDESEKFTATFGELKTPFGSERMQILELLAAFISSRYVNLMIDAMNMKLLETCFDLFFKFAWNNLLHIHVQQITNVLLESDSPQIISHMFEKLKIHEILANAGNSEVEGTAYLRKGYMGVVALLATSIENLSNTNPVIKNAIDNSDEWQNYIKGDLFEMRKKESKPLGGVPERPDNNDDDDDKSAEISGLHTAIKFAFENGLPSDFSVTDFDKEEDLVGFCFTDTERLLAGIPVE